MLNIIFSSCSYGAYGTKITLCAGVLCPIVVKVRACALLADPSSDL